jgi:hypothetical protein
MCARSACVVEAELGRVKIEEWIILETKVVEAAQEGSVRIDHVEMNLDHLALAGGGIKAVKHRQANLPS